MTSSIALVIGVVAIQFQDGISLTRLERPNAFNGVQAYSIPCKFNP
jgi:hypothetical protein